MIRTFPIDFVRQIIEQKLESEHNKQPSKYYGGKDQVNLFSFYEQLQKGEDVERYQAIYRDLVNQQNRTGLIMNGTIIAPENPTITNLYDCDIIPLTFTCSFRVKLANRDMAIETINNLIKMLKGKKVDVAEYNDGRLFAVGTIHQQIKYGDYIGAADDTTSADLTIDVRALLQALHDKGVESCDYYNSQNNTSYDYVVCDYLYISNDAADKIKVVHKKADKTWEICEDIPANIGVLEAPNNGEWQKTSVSLSFDSIRCDEPRTLNADEYCVISFGGSATIVSNGVKLGNEMYAVGIKKLKIPASPSDITITDTIHWLEPLEMPSGNGANTKINQLMSNNFITNTHTDNITITNQYTFVDDKEVGGGLVSQFFKYGRYGIQADGTTITYTNGITPNMIYEITELWSCWGDVDIFKFKAKVIESIDIENTESDVLSITIPFQVQGDNN